MGTSIDLRKYNIRTEADAIEFLELIVSKAPQLVQFMKNQKLKNASLQARLDNAAPAQPQNTYANEDASVLDRMTGAAGRTVASSPAQSRIEQMKSAQTQTPPAAPAPTSTPDDNLPPAPVAPGEIGQLNIPNVDAKVPQVTDPPAVPQTDEEKQLADALVDAANATADGDGVDSDQASASEEDAAQAAGSKSERTPDDGVQSEDASDEGSEELSEEEAAAKAALEAPSSKPTQDDITPVGTKAARAAAKKKKK